MFLLFFVAKYKGRERLRRVNRTQSINSPVSDSRIIRTFANQNKPTAGCDISRNQLGLRHSDKNYKSLKPTN